MELNHTPLAHTPLSIRDLARFYEARENRGNGIRLAAGALAVLLIAGAGFGYIFRDALTAARGEQVLGQQDRRSAEGSGAIVRPEPSDQAGQKPARYADEYIEFDLPEGWAARRFSSELVPNLLRVIEIFPASELPVFDSEGKPYKSMITVSITKERTDTGPVPGNAKTSLLPIDGVMAKVIEQRLEENFSDTLNNPLEGINYTVNFPLGDNTVVIVYRTAAPANSLKQRGEMLMNFLKSVELPGKKPVAPDPVAPEETGAASELLPEPNSDPVEALQPSATPGVSPQPGPASAEADLKEFRMQEF